MNLFYTLYLVGLSLASVGATYKPKIDADLLKAVISYPDPIQEPGQCGRQKAGFLCDPDGVLPHAASSRLDNKIISVNCVDSEEHCNSSLLIVVIKQLPGTQSPQKKIDMFVHTLRERWLEKEHHKTNKMMIGVLTQPIMGALSVDAGTKSILGVDVTDRINGYLQDVLPGMGVTEVLDEAVGALTRKIKTANSKKNQFIPSHQGFRFGRRRRIGGGWGWGSSDSSGVSIIALIVLGTLGGGFILIILIYFCVKKYCRPHTAVTPVGNNGNHITMVDQGTEKVSCHDSDTTSSTNSSAI